MSKQPNSSSAPARPADNNRKGSSKGKWTAPHFCSAVVVVEVDRQRNARCGSFPFCSHSCLPGRKGKRKRNEKNSRTRTFSRHRAEHTNNGLNAKTRTSSRGRKQLHCAMRLMRRQRRLRQSVGVGRRVKSLPAASKWIKFTSAAIVVGFHWPSALVALKFTGKDNKFYHIMRFSFSAVDVRAHRSRTGNRRRPCCSYCVYKVFSSSVSNKRAQQELGQQLRDVSWKTYKRRSTPPTYTVGNLTLGSPLSRNGASSSNAGISYDNRSFDAIYLVPAKRKRVFPLEAARSEAAQLFFFIHRFFFTGYTHQRIEWFVVSDVNSFFFFYVGGKRALTSFDVPSMALIGVYFRFAAHEK